MVVTLAGSMPAAFQIVLGDDQPAVGAQLAAGAGIEQHELAACPDGGDGER